MNVLSFALHRLTDGLVIDCVGTTLRDINKKYSQKYDNNKSK